MKAIKSTSVPQASKKTISSHAVLPQQPDWAKLMAQWESSGLPKSKFCQSRGITYHLFIYHCDKLNKNKKQTEKFIPVKRTQEAGGQILIYDIGSKNYYRYDGFLNSQCHMSRREGGQIFT
jgi:hypothetical protein